MGISCGCFAVHTRHLVRIPIDAITSIVWQKDKTHPVSIESERSPSGMCLKQFDNKNLSINLELTKICIVENNEKFQQANATAKRVR